MYIGGVQYEVGSTVKNFRDENGYSILFNLADMSGNLVTLPGIAPVKILQYPLRGMHVSAGSYGITTHYDEQGVFEQYGGPTTLRWARNTIIAVGIRAGGGTYDLDYANVEVNDPLYTKYQWVIFGMPPGQTRPLNLDNNHDNAYGTSGSSVWARNGWEGWGFSTDMINAYTPPISEIQTYVPTFDYQPSVPVPAATKTWDPYSNLDAGDPINWAEGSLPTSTDTVWVDDHNYAAKVFSGALLAQDLFVGAAAATGPAATVSLEGGDVTVSDSVYVGAETGTQGQVRLVTDLGVLSAQRAYIGYRGTGTVTHYLGTVNIDNLLVVGKASGGTGTYNLGIVGQTSAGNLVVGAEPGSTGTFNLLTGGTITAPMATIGD